jgi:hypothetical protein
MRGWTLVVWACLAAACGARSGLEVEPSDGPDVSALDASIRDAGLDAPIDVRTCSRSVVLAPARAEVVLVLDRSGSMGRETLASTGMTRWAALREALSVALPPFDGVIELGATFYPEPTMFLGVNTCVPSPALDLAIGAASTGSVLAVFDSFIAQGGTPTASALAVARSTLRPRAGLGISQTVVLATDGSPNCNPSDAAEPWFGVGSEYCADAGFDPVICIDDDATLAVIDGLRTDGVATYVIGMDVTDALLVDVLSRMARAGGRARAGATPYYDIERPSDLVDALGDVAGRVTRCALVPSAPVDGAMGHLEIDGAVVPADGGSGEGWSEGPGGTIELQGASCAAAREGRSVLWVPDC